MFLISSVVFLFFPQYGIYQWATAVSFHWHKNMFIKAKVNNISKDILWLVGLGVWFSLWVREVPGSNPGRARYFYDVFMKKRGGEAGIYHACFNCKQLVCFTCSTSDSLWSKYMWYKNNVLFKPNLFSQSFNYSFKTWIFFLGMY